MDQFKIMARVSGRKPVNLVFLLFGIKGNNFIVGNIGNDLT